MAPPVLPTEGFRIEIDDHIDSEGVLGQVTGKLAGMGACVLHQNARHAKVSALLGRPTATNAPRGAEAMNGFRNGYEELTTKTASGWVTLARRNAAHGLTGYGARSPTNARNA